MPEARRDAGQDAEVDRVAESKARHAKDGTEPPKPVTWLGGLVLKCVTRAATALLGAEKALTEADTKVGDGDCGSTFARGAAALLEDAPHCPRIRRATSRWPSA